MAILEATMDAGAEEVKDQGETWEVISEATDLVPVRSALQEAGIDYDSADLAFVPNVEVPLSVEDARKLAALVDAIEDLDDVQNIYDNADISDDTAAALAED